MYYFGCISGGHFLHDTDLRKIYNEENLSLPINVNCLDGGFLGNVQDIPGHGRLFYIAGYTILTFWDRSGDKRLNSNSAFIVQGIKHFPEMIKVCNAQFPSLFKRFDFDIVWVEANCKAVKINNWETV